MLKWVFRVDRDGTEYWELMEGIPNGEGGAVAYRSLEEDYEPEKEE